MEWLLIGSVLVLLYGVFAMFRFTFNLIDRAHERLREESRESGMPLTEESGG